MNLLDYGTGSFVMGAFKMKILPSFLYKRLIGPLFGFLAVIGIGSFVVIPLLIGLFGIGKTAQHVVFGVTWVLGCFFGATLSVLFLRELSQRINVSRFTYVAVPCIFIILTLVLIVGILAG